VGLRGVAKQVRIEPRVGSRLFAQWDWHRPRTKVAVQYLYTNLRQEMCSFARPSHLSLLRKTLADDLIDRRLRYGTADFADLSHSAVHSSTNTGRFEALAVPTAVPAT
jgi:hypothetical protein